MRVGSRLGYVVSGLTLALSAASCSTANIVDVYTAIDAGGVRRRSLFFTDTRTIHCIVEAGVSRRGSTLEILIRQIERLDPVTSALVPADRVHKRQEYATATGGELELFSAQLEPNEDRAAAGAADAGADGGAGDGNDGPSEVPNEPGVYQCEAYIDGKRHGGTASFRVEFADCPPAEIVTGMFCRGFYQQGRECKRFGESSSEPAVCACRGNFWECP